MKDKSGGSGTWLFAFPAAVALYGSVSQHCASSSEPTLSAHSVLVELIHHGDENLKNSQ